MTDGLRMGVVGIDHRHIYTMTAQMEAAGCTLVGWATEGSPGTLPGFVDRFPAAPRVADADVLLDDPSIDLILTAAVPADRAGIACRAMRAGKDVLSDKPGCLTLSDLAALRSAVEETGRRWAVDFSERLEVPAVTRAMEFIAAGAIGEVVHTLGIGPHRLNRATRPDWFFDPARNGGILIDIASHQIDQFLVLTGSSRAEIVHASVACLREPGFQDLGEIALTAGRARGYIKVDWFTPDGLPTWGDGRLFVTGTEGTIELRKYVDVGGAPGTDHLFLTTGGRCERIDASGAGLPFFAAFAQDIRARTAAAMPVEHPFTVMALAIEAQAMAERAPC